MVLGFFDRLFSSRTWKIITILLYGFLIFSFLQLLIVADKGIQISVESASRMSQDLASYMKVAYFNGVIAISVFIFLGATWLTRNIKEISKAQRYRSLAQLMKRYARGNSLARYQEKGTDEVSQLGKTFNFLADSQQRLIAELRNYEQQKQEMVVSIAHDLGGPLTAISGYLKTLMTGLQNSLQPEQHEYFEIIQANLKNVRKLVQELSELAKLDVDNFPIQKEVFSLKVLTSDIISRYSIEAKNKTINLSVSEDSADCLILADLHLIERAVSNLIENAIRYTENGGKITVLLKESGGNALLEIFDNGIGIPEQDLPFVFDRFYRVDKARSKSSGGSGLGLAITKKIISLHSGEIEIESEEGKGTHITVRLSLNSET